LAKEMHIGTSPNRALRFLQQVGSKTILKKLV